MKDNFNTAAGWVLFSGIVALGFSILSGMFFSADKPHRPHEMGYVIEGVDAGGGGAAEGPSLAALLHDGSADEGAKVFAKCLACHTIEQGGATGIGPNLYGTVGEAIGTGKGGFAFSSALTGVGGEWTFENLDAWLKSPRAFANGTKMSFAGLSKPEDRANVMLYLMANGGGPALPTAPAEEPAEAEGGDAVAAPADVDAGDAGAVAAEVPVAADQAATDVAE